MEEKLTYEELIAKHGTLLEFVADVIETIGTAPHDVSKKEAIIAIRNYNSALEEASATATTIECISGVSHRTRQGFVKYSWGTQRTQFTADQAREHAYTILEAAEAGISDAAVISFLTKKLGVDDEKAMQLIFELRNHRADMKAQGTIQ